MLSERLGKWSFWTMFISFNVAFFPMHIVGLLGMPRRVSTYLPGLGWDNLNLIETIGGFAFGIGAGITLFNFFWSRRHGALAPANPWHSDSLEWSVPSPPPEYNFATTPIVTSRHPLWDEQPLPVSSSVDGDATRALAVEGAASRDMAETTVFDAQPEGPWPVPPDTYLPFFAAVALAIFFLGLLMRAQLIGWAGVAIAVVCLLRWMWRTDEELR
jgi:cytochrome c oxidase subunit 1/cytochrome c oxidase subunit I+III